MSNPPPPPIQTAPVVLFVNTPTWVIRVPPSWQEQVSTPADRTGTR